MKKLWLYILFCPALTLAADLKLEISGLHPKSGLLLIAVYDQAEAFNANAHTQAVYLAECKLKPVLTHTVPDLNPGEYAVALLHDENGNYAMDRTFIGRPKEGYGFSNNVGRFKKPSFKKAAFRLREKGAALPIKMRYPK